MIVSPKEWLYASICFIVGLVMLYNYSLANTIPSYIMIPIDLTGAISFILFFRSISKEKEVIKNQHQYY